MSSRQGRGTKGRPLRLAALSFSDGAPPAALYSPRESRPGSPWGGHRSRGRTRTLTSITDTASLLSGRGITKTFPGVVANDGVTFDVHGGEGHALVGETAPPRWTRI